MIDRWTQLKSGGLFRPLANAPNFEVVTYDDIAHGISRQYRFGGHLADLTVAEHCCLLHDIVPLDLKPVALFHDMMEGLGLPDVQLPFKDSPQLQGYFDLDHEKTLQALTYYGLSIDDYLTLKDYDRRIAVSEAKAMFKTGLAIPTPEWTGYIEANECLPYDLELAIWDKDEAKSQWLARLASL